MTLTDSPVFAVAMMLAGLAAGTAWYAFRLQKEGLPVPAALLGAVIGSALALLCAKAGYLLHDLGASLFEGYFDEALSFGADTLSFAGGCLGFIAGTMLAARISGVRPAKALDLFAAPGCVFLCLARLAEAGMDMIGVGNQVEASWLQFFPLVIRNGWDDAFLSVFVLEALTALVCLVPALCRRGMEPEGTAFRRTAVCLLGAQIGWEMLLQYPYIRSFLYSFVSLEQVIFAVPFLALVIHGCVKNGKWWTLPVVLALLGCSVFFQFLRDNKLDFIYNEGFEWLAENVWTISDAAFLLISAGLIAAALTAVKHRNTTKNTKM